MKHEKSSARAHRNSASLPVRVRVPSLEDAPVGDQLDITSRSLKLLCYGFVLPRLQVVPVWGVLCSDR